MKDQEIIKDYYNGISLEDIIKKHKTYPSKVYKLRKKFNLKSRPRRKSRYNDKIRKWNFNLDFFKNPDKISAYWLGFIYADGCLSKNKYSYSLTVSLHEDDRDFLKKFVKAVGLSEDALYKGQKRKKATIRLNHVDLFKYLKNFSIIPNKTYVFHSSNIRPDFIPHFLRGWFDGDGYWKKDDKGGSIRITGSNCYRESYEKL